MSMFMLTRNIPVTLYGLISLGVLIENDHTKKETAYKPDHIIRILED
jgi:hypothetical protein